MADLDAELLALAGGDSSDEEETKPVENTTIIDSPSSAGSPGDHANSASASKPSVAPKKTTKAKAGAKKGAKKGRRDEYEEGEASSSPGSPDSLDSAPMSESDGEGSPAAGSDNDDIMFPVDGKFLSEKDKAEIMALPEIRREGILAERSELIQKKQQDQILRRLYEGYKAKENVGSKDEQGQKKRKANAADIEEVQRKSSRQKTTLGGRKVGETSDAMEAYKRQREQKGILAEQRKTEAAERKARKGRGSASTGSEADADGESEVEWDDGKPKAGARPETVVQDERPADLLDFNHVRIGRENFARVCFYPGFETTIKDCYVRIALGVDKATGENVYRLAQIKKITEGRPYAMEGVNGKPFTTSQYALVAVGKSEKEWPFIACSNSKFTDREFDRYVKTMTTESLPLPTRRLLLNKIEDINKLINHRFTDAEIAEKLKRSGVLNTKYIALERNKLQDERKEAEDRGNEAAIARIDAELAKLDGPKLAFGTSLIKAQDNSPIVKSQQQRLGELNAANRKANTQNVRKALQRERKLKALQRAAIERGEATTDPHARVKVMAKTHHKVGEYLTVAKSVTDELFSGSEGASRAVTPISRSVTPATQPSNSQPEKPSRFFDLKTIVDPDAAIAEADIGINMDEIMAL